MLKELLDEEIDEETLLSYTEYDIASVRQLMVRREQLLAQREKNAEIKRAVFDSYEARDQKLTDDVARLEQRIRNAVQDLGTVSLPDVGTAYLARTKAKVDILDRAAAQLWAQENG